eukprot:1512688-Amphidinium_carterae.1
MEISERSERMMDAEETSMSRRIGGSQRTTGRIAQRRIEARLEEQSRMMGQIDMLGKRQAQVLAKRSTARRTPRKNLVGISLSRVPRMGSGRGLHRRSRQQSQRNVTNVRWKK